MLFIKIDTDISLLQLNAVGEVKMVAFLNTYTNLPEIFLEYKKTKFLMSFGDDSENDNVLPYCGNSLADGEATNISLYIDDKYYMQAVSLMKLLDIHRIRSFMIKLEDFE